MEAKVKQELVPCVPGVLPGGLKRTRFFDGMFLTQKDLEREQKYWTIKRRMTNRALGKGVVWGLRLDWDMLNRRFILFPGYGVDCCGNDLIVECEQAFDERKLIERADTCTKALISGRHMSSDRCPKVTEDRPRKVGVILQYVECPEEPKPVYKDACTTNVTQCEYSSIRESTQLLLVPPPSPTAPGPVNNFCSDVEALREACEAAGVSCNLFQKLAETDAVRLRARIRVQELDAARLNVAYLSPSLDLEGNPAVSQTLDLSAANATLGLCLEPDPGYVFLAGQLIDGAGNTSALSPFGMERVEVTLGASPVVYTVTDLVVAPLFNKGAHHKLAITLTLTGDPVNQQVVINAETTEVEVVEEAGSCSDLVSPALIFNTSALCATKMLALNAMCGWFKSLISPVDEGTVNVRQEVAWLICLLSWRLLFKANLDADAEAKLNALVQKLFSELCAGLVYPGPRCYEEHHGVYLGSIEFSKNGGIKRFSPWEYRRHVLTGPLLNHWLGQFGFAPIDMVAGRMAQWICCLAKNPLPMAAQQGAALAGSYVPITKDGAGLYYGTDYDIYLQNHGLSQAGDLHEVSATEFASLLTQNLLYVAPGEDRSGLAGRRVYSITGRQDIFLMLPSSLGLVIRPPNQGRNPRGELGAIIEGRTRELRPLARSVVGDFLLELANNTALSSLRVPENSSTFQPLVKALNSAGVATVGDYLSLGTEAAARLAMPYAAANGINSNESVYAAAEDVFDAGEELLSKTAKPLVSAAKGSSSPFTRDKLSSDALVTDIRKSAATALKRNLFTKADVTAIAEKVIAIG